MGFLGKIIEGSGHLQVMPCGIHYRQIDRRPPIVSRPFLGICDIAFIGNQLPKNFLLNRQGTITIPYLKTKSLVAASMAFLNPRQSLGHRPAKNAFRPRDRLPLLEVKLSAGGITNVLFDWKIHFGEIHKVTNGNIVGHRK